MDCQRVLDYTIGDMIKKISKTSGLLLVALLGLLGIVFVFSEPTHAPSLDLDKQMDSSEVKNPTENTFITLSESTKIGEGVIADSFLIYDENSGAVIATKNPDTAVAIASITKLMTAYVIQKYGSLEDTWAINNASTNNINPVLGLVPGDIVKIEDLTKAMLIGSANDAAQALGLYLTTAQNKSAIELMNDEAELLGMDSTHYENSIGFDSEQNYSTANDLKILVSKTRSLPLFSGIDRKTSYSFVSQTGRSYSVKATNTMLSTDSEIHAVKTGFTDEAKGAMIIAVKHEDKNFVVIVLGSTKRELDTKILKQQVIEAII